MVTGKQNEGKRNRIEVIGDVTKKQSYKFHTTVQVRLTPSKDSKGGMDGEWKVDSSQMNITSCDFESWESREKRHLSTIKNAAIQGELHLSEIIM